MLDDLLCRFCRLPYWVQIPLVVLIAVLLEIIAGSHGGSFYS